LNQKAEIHQHSGWLIPLGVALVILALCGMFLLYYLRPVSGTFRDNRPTAAATRVALTVRGVSLSIPANYIETRGARGGGDMDVVPVFALLPDMRGYSDTDRAAFASNAPDSAVLHLQIKADTNSLDPASRFTRIYRPYMVDPQGTPGPFGLTRYEFRADSGYGRNDLFVGPDANHGTLLLLCERPAQDLPSPNCLAIDRPIAPNVNLAYRFKRSQLAQWRLIDNGVSRLVSSFLDS